MHEVLASILSRERRGLRMDWQGDGIEAVGLPNNDTMETLGRA